RKGADLIAQLVEQVAERRKGQLPFVGRRPRLQDAEASTASLVETGGPQRRLADSGVAFEQQLRPGVSAQELEDAIELCLAPDESRRGRQGHVEDDATARSAGQVILTRSGGPARAVSHPRVTMSRAQPRLASDRSRALARDSRRPRTSAAGSTSRTRSRAHAGCRHAGAWTAGPRSLGRFARRPRGTARRTRAARAAAGAGPTRRVSPANERRGFPSGRTGAGVHSRRATFRWRVRPCPRPDRASRWRKR